MARRLDVAPKTVSNTLSTVYAKLGVTEAALRARHAGLGGAGRGGWMIVNSPVRERTAGAAAGKLDP
jgi:hypothetical protein